MEYIDVLDPNTFQKTGVVKPILDAWKAGDWIGTFNLWIVQSINDTNFILYQQRTSRGGWSAGLLDVTAGGHYRAGENIEDGLREVREELGKDYDFSQLTYLGKKLYLYDQGEYKRRNAVDVFIVVDNSALETFRLQREELDGLFRCSIQDLIKVHTQPNYSFTVEGIKFSEQLSLAFTNNTSLVAASILVTKDTFPYNWDNYHLKMVLLAERFLKGESYLLY